MSMQGLGLNVVAAIAILVVVFAAAAAWLFLTSPATVATAVSEGDVTPFIRDLALVLLGVLESLLQYL